MPLYDETICRDRFAAAAAAFVSPDASPFFRCCLPPSYETGAANFTMERFLLKNLPTDEPTHAYGSTHRFKPDFGNGFDFPLTAHVNL